MLEPLSLAFVAFLIVLLNAFFVLAEFAIVKVRTTRLEELAERRVPNAKLALHIVSHLDNYLSATQLGITLTSLALGWIGEPAFAHLFESLISAPGWVSTAAAHTMALTVAFLFITFMHILVGELAPKSIAIQHSEKSTLFVARPLRLFERLFVVPLTVMNGASRALLRALGVPPASEAEVTYTEEELRTILGASQERGGFSFHHLLLLENAFDFGELHIRDVMLPLDQVACLDPAKPWAENAAIVAEKRLSRYPLREGTKGKITGLVHVKTILFDLLQGRTPDIRRDALKVPRASQDLLLEAALRKLQRSGEHMGIATNVKGEDVGMFTLEDIVEELIGDVRDEFEPSREVSIGELLRDGTVILDPVVSGSEELVELLVRMALRGAEGVDPSAAVEAVRKRDRQVPASFGGGVAIPHARVKGLKEPRGAFARLGEGVPYAAPDGRPVRLAFAILTPDDAAPGTQVRLLRKMGSLLDSDYLRSRLLQATTPEEVREVIRVGESSASA
jgi:CBS domain containing-hemolysin-like protein